MYGQNLGGNQMSEKNMKIEISTTFFILALIIIIIITSALGHYYLSTVRYSEPKERPLTESELADWNKLQAEKLYEKLKDEHGWE